MDEQGEVGPVNVCVSESTVSVTVPGGEENLMGNLGSEGLVEDAAYSEGEEGEIMVEVVGTDVFVGGIRGRDEGLGKEMEAEPFRNEGDIGARRGDGDEHGLEMEKVEVAPQLAGDRTEDVAVEKVEAEVSEEIVEGRVAETDVPRDSEPNDRCDEVVGGLEVKREKRGLEMEKAEVVSELTGECTHNPAAEKAEAEVYQEMVEGRARDSESNAGCDSVHGGSEVKGDERGLEMEKAEVVSELAGEHTHVSSVDKVEAEASQDIVEGKVPERHVPGDAESNDDVDGGSVVKNVGVSDNETCNPGNDSASASASLLTESASGHTSCNGEKAAADRVEDLHDGVSNATPPSIGEGRGLAVETASGATEKDERNHETSESSDNPPTGDDSMQVDMVEKDAILQSDNASMSDDVHQDTKMSGIHDSVEGEPVVVTSEPINEVSEGAEYLGTEGRQLVGINQTSSCDELPVVAERSDNMEADSEGLLDVKDNNLSCSQNDEDTKNMKLHESYENVRSQTNILPDGGSTAPVDGVVATLVNKDEVIKSEVGTDLKDSHASIKYNVVNKSISLENDLLDADAGIYSEQPLIPEENTEVMDESHEEKLKAQHFSGVREKEGMEVAPEVPLCEDMDTETHKIAEEDTSKGSTCDTSHDANISFLENEEKLKVEMVGVSVVEHDAVGAEAGICSTTHPDENLVSGEQYLDTDKQVILEQQVEAALIQETDPGESKHLLISMDVNATSGGNVFSCSPEVNVHVSSNDVSPHGGDRSLEDPTSDVVNPNEHIVHVDATNTEPIDLLQAAEVDKINPGLYQSDNFGEGIGTVEHSPETIYNTIKPDSSFELYQPGYLAPPENEGQFAVSDVVWVKVDDHLWWPGQILDPADASEEAATYFKNDSFLVACFGDRAFAWSDASALKPFTLHFDQMEKQSDSEVFKNAVSCALTEICRRVELGLACHCIPRDVYSNIEYQIVDNMGIREESSKQYLKDKSSGATSFEPDKLADYLRGLAQAPLGGTDQLNLVIARAQLLALCRHKGCRPPPELVCSEEVDETRAEVVEHHESEDEQNLSSKSTSHKGKHDSVDSLQPTKKEKSLSDLMDETAYSPDDEDVSDGKAQDQSVCSSLDRKRKAVDALGDGSEKRINICVAKVSTTRLSFPKPSFKIGECIRKVASQLTGSASLKPNSDQSGNDVSPRGSLEFASLEDMLLQLQWLAQNPREGQKFLNNAVTFFSCFRNSVVPVTGPNLLDGKPDSGGKRKTSEAVGGATEEYEFNEVSDSYWTGRTVEDYSEGQLLQNGENGGARHQLVVTSDPDRSLRSGRRPYTKRRYSIGNHQMGGEVLNNDVDRKLQLSSPAQLILKFSEVSLPSEVDLNKIFRRFGPLKESETLVHRESRHAKVVFKRGADAEVAYSSAGMFNIFGSTPVTYQLSYLPPSSFRVLPPGISYQEDTV